MVDIDRCPFVFLLWSATPIQWLQVSRRKKEDSDEIRKVLHMFEKVPSQLGLLLHDEMPYLQWKTPWKYLYEETVRRSHQCVDGR